MAGSLSVESDKATLLVDGVVVRESSLSDLSYSDRIGRTSRKVSWPDGSVLETLDNDAVDELFQLARQSGALSNSESREGRFSHLIHGFERSWKWAAIACVASVALVGSFSIWGLPYMSKKIAFTMPVSAHQTVSDGSLNILDRVLLDPSELTTDEKAVISQRFTAMTEQLGDQGFPFTLHFRSMENTPNAFALPGGDIIITDALVKISTDTDEVDAVLLHEIGHVLERHGMQQTIRASTITIIVSLALGDISGLGEIITGIPIFLANSNYSRNAETEADDYALRNMVLLNKDPIHLANILLKMEAHFRKTSPIGSSTKDSKTNNNDESDAKENEESASTYFSSHPATRERAQIARQRSEEFRKGLQ